MPSKKKYGKKETHEEFKFVKKLGNANQNRMGAWVVRCFLSCAVLFAPHCNDVAINVLNIVNILWSTPFGM